jgi:hypothetical protein
MDSDYESDESSVTVYDEIYYTCVHIQRHELLKERVGYLLHSLLLTYEALGQLLYVIDHLTLVDSRLVPALELFYRFVMGARNAVASFNYFHEDFEERCGESNLANPRARHVFQANMEEQGGELDRINRHDTTAIKTWLTENASEFLILPDFPDVDMDALN